MRVDSDVQQASGASVAYLDHGLQCGYAHQVAAQHSLHLLCGARAYDRRPVRGGLYSSRTGLWAELDARCGCGWWLCGPRRTPACAALVARSLLHRIVLLGKETCSRTPHHVERASIHLETRTSQGTSPSTGRGHNPEMHDRISPTRGDVHPIG